MLALGLAVFYLLVIIAPLVSPTHIAIYHLNGSIYSIVLPVFLNLTVVWLLLAGLLLLAQRPGKLRILVWSTLILTMPWVLLKNYAVLTQKSTLHKLSLIVFSLTLIALLLLWFLWKPKFLPPFERVQRLAMMMIAFASLSGLFVVGQLIRFTWQARNLNQPRPLHQRQFTSATRVPKKRIVWLVLDELSYEQVYERRFPGLQLPAFDQLAAQSSVFTQTVPVAVKTEIVIPSLMTGIKTDQITASADGQLALHNAVTNRWQPFDAHQTVFEDALDSGYSTAIDGWFNPYCRILAAVSDHCFWSSYVSFLGPALYVDGSVLGNFLKPAHLLFDTALSYLSGHGHTDPDKRLGAQLHIEDYKDISTAADRLLADSSTNFFFLHIPVPHPEGIYSRETSRMTDDGNSSYIDNLALADQYLAHLHFLLEQRSEWDSTTIVVMGDHSWRTTLFWQPSLVWTPEDEAASHGGQFDDRPAYIVKLPNQQQGSRIDDRFDAVRTRALLDGIIADRIKTPEDLAAWVRQGK